MLNTASPTTTDKAVRSVLKRVGGWLGRNLLLSVAAIVAPPAIAQSIPSIDTEDASLGSQSITSKGWIHPSFGVDLRNGDFARANYDDDAANLDRLPVHVQVGVAFDLAKDASNNASTWLVLRSSNGFHSPIAAERISPRDWYESNNLAALVFTPAAGLRTAAIYTIKTSPNGISSTTHEASLSLSYDGKDPIGKLSPKFAITMRPKGDHGVFTLAGIEPGIELGSGKQAPTLSFPLAVGIGWGGFYGAGTGDRKFASPGVAIEKPFKLGRAPWSLRLEGLALIRDNRLARLSGPDGETGTVVPLVTLSLSTAY